MIPPSIIVLALGAIGIAICLMVMRRSSVAIKNLDRASEFLSYLDEERSKGYMTRQQLVMFLLATRGADHTKEYDEDLRRQMEEIKLRSVVTKTVEEVYNEEPKKL